MRRQGLWALPCKYLEPVVNFDKYINTDKDTGCIMDDPARTMGHPVIDFNAEKAAEKEAKEGKATVEYFKAAGVRVVNMSWGGSRAGIEDAIEKKIPGMSKEERAELSRKIFKISRDALEEAIKGAPEILFIAAAGNEDNDNEFAETLPSCLNLPNLLTVGAIDSAGKPTSFTTFGKNVKLFANGFEVESNVPGGKRLKYSGTSMAAPNAANIAGKLLALNPKLTTAQVIDLLTKGASPLEGQGDRFILNAKASIDLLKSGK